MDVNLCENEIYQRPWGKHKNGFIKLTYNSGSYATIQKIKDGVIVEDKIIKIDTNDGDYNIEKFAKENNLVRI